jgi:hypothetical protein
MYAQSSPQPRGRRAALAPFRTEGDSVVAAHLWNHPEIGSHIKAYVGEKVARAGQHKARLFEDVDKESLYGISYAEQTLVGAHGAYRGETPFARVLRASSGAAEGNFIEDWHDAKRIVFYHYLVNVPLYGFPRVTGQLQSAYRAHQENPRKAWYLHCDRCFEGIDDLDPKDIKQAMVEHQRLRLPLHFAAGLLDFDEDGGVLFNNPKTGKARHLAESIEELLPELAAFGEKKPELYNEVFAQYDRASDRATAKHRIDDEMRQLLSTYERKLSDRVTRLEAEDEADRAGLLASMRHVLAATRGLLELKTAAKAP